MQDTEDLEASDEPRDAQLEDLKSIRWFVLQAEVERLTALLNTPLLDDFTAAVKREAAHQVERWASQDARKQPEDWFWTLGHLARKALRAHIDGHRDKALHHTISSAALLLHWHRRSLDGRSRSNDPET